MHMPRTPGYCLIRDQRAIAVFLWLTCVSCPAWCQCEPPTSPFDALSHLHAISGTHEGAFPHSLLKLLFSLQSVVSKQEFMIDLSCETATISNMCAGVQLQVTNAGLVTTKLSKSMGTDENASLQLLGSGNSSTTKDHLLASGSARLVGICLIQFMCSDVQYTKDMLGYQQARFSSMLFSTPRPILVDTARQFFCLLATAYAPGIRADS